MSTLTYKNVADRDRVPLSWVGEVSLGQFFFNNSFSNVGGGNPAQLESWLTGSNIKLPVSYRIRFALCR